MLCQGTTSERPRFSMATVSLSTPSILLLLLHVLSASSATQNDLVITTKHGQVQGKLVPVPGGDVRAFLGIPYAKPPLGKLRFRAPEPAGKWDGVRGATMFPNSCHQVPDTAYPGFKGAEMWNPNTPLSEDCLYLNVWSPHANKTQPQPVPLAPVLVWIYGGGFTAGTSSLDIYDGRFLCKSEGVVVVSMNYRLGVFGFLSLPDNKNIRGNAGLLDQRLALQWVANNIAAFGGDPSKDLWDSTYYLQGAMAFFRGQALKLASLLKCPTSPPAKLEACLQEAHPEEATNQQYSVLTKRSLLALPFVPVVDGDFLPDKPEMLLNMGKLPKKELLLGLNKDEGTYFLLYGAPGFSLSGDSLISRKEYLEGVDLTLAEASNVTREVAIFQYSPWTDEENGMKNRDLLGSLVGDQNFVCPVIEFAKRYSQHGGRTFMYLFDHRSSVNPWPVWMGVMHGYEIEFVFGMPLNANLGYTKNEVNMTKNIMKHWANFARTGNPSTDGFQWPMYTPEKQEYVTLNYHPPQIKKMMSAHECHLWNKLMPSVQRVSDDLQSCFNAVGIILHCNYKFLFILLVTGLLLC
ncbi:hypothetical protein INR49_018698 [Caranx melampygus]|nr:hypothetical protein INR49_018698 [Caranx melampygus]